MTKTLLPLTLFTLIVSAQTQHQPRQADHGGSKAAQSSRAQRSEEVGDLLAATNEARIAVDSHNSKDALFHIDHALQNASELESNSNNSRFVPLYQELDRYTVLAPIMTERNQTSNSSASSQTSNSTGNAPHSAHPTVQRVAGEYTSVGLDVQAAKEHLNAAKTAIQQNDYSKADAALAAVQNGVVVTSVASDLPLVRARENMILARDAANRGDYKEAHAALTSASQALGNYSNNQGTHSSDAKMLKSQIDSFNQSIQQNHADAASKIDTWWDQMADWTATASNQSHK